MFKGLISEVAKDAGRSAALIINQLFQWYKGSNSKKIYRTNQELHDDLCGIMSTATIQRCKKRLIEKGYIEVSFDKGLNRVTHYSLTKKALDLLDSNKVKLKDNTETLTNSGTTVTKSSKTSPQSVKTEVKSNVSSSMKKSFEEQGKKRENVVKGIPDALKHLLKSKDEDIHEEQEDQLTPSDYDECDLAMLNALNNQEPYSDNKLTVGQLLGSLGSVYKSGVSEARERIYQMSQINYRYSEDY